MIKWLTVSVASYNVEKCLRKCLNSFMVSEIMDDIEVLIIDDGSIDGTAVIGEEYEKKYPGTFKLIRKTNGGHGSTINTGIKNASGKYFKTVDADDWVDQKGILKLLKYVKKTDADMILTNYKSVDVNGNILSENVSMLQSFNMYEKDVIFEDIISYIRDDLPMHMVTYKTEILKKMPQRIQEHCFYVDVEYVIYPLKYIKKAAVLDEFVYMYLLGTEEQSVNINNMIKRRGQHQKVVNNLIEYYSNAESDYMRGIDQVVFKRIALMVLWQYYIFFNINNENNIKEEVKQFDEKVRNQNIDLYNAVLDKNIGQGKLIKKVIFLLRKSQFKGYQAVIRVYQLIKGV